MRIGILTGGGDAPGLNAAIRAVVKSAANHGAETIGIEDGFAGLIDPTHWRRLTPKDVPGILRLGGTVLGTTNRRNPLAYPAPTGGVVDYSARCVDTFHRLELDALVVIGGDGTLAIANEFCKRGVPIVCIPKTIDNDIAETTSSFGFDSAVSFATDAIDRLHTTAEAHHRVIVVEVMGRYAGWIALHAGVAGGADVILIPEIPYDLDKVAHHILAREGLGARFSIVVAAEGATAVGAGYTIRQLGSASAAERLGGIGERLVKDLECKTHKEMRSVTLGHLQRGGAPTSADRLLATRFGARALELVLEQKWGTMVALQPPDIMAEGQFQPPKTQKAVRTIPLGPHAIAALTAHRQRVSRRAPEALVFGNRKGDPLRESKLLTNVLQPAAEAAGLGRVTWHQFRHIHSSLLNDLKVPVNIAQEQLGHASISTTLNIYTHVVDASHRTAVGAVEARLFSDVDPNGPKLAIVPKTDSAVNARSA